jgi:hypothetical protein
MAKTSGQNQVVVKVFIAGIQPQMDAAPRGYSSPRNQAV